MSEAKPRYESQHPGNIPTPVLTVLLVDDEESIRAIIKRVLGRAGHSILEAKHGAEALRVAEAHVGRIDLIITDMYMPGLRGPEIVEGLRPLRPALRVLYMSGYGDGDVARSGVSPEGAFLRKPFTVEELNDAVAKAMGDQK